MKTSEQINELAVPAAPNGNGHKRLVMKLAEVMAAVERVPKRGRNDFHGYDYATEADIAATIRKELASRHIILLPGITSHEREKIGDKGTVLTTLGMAFTFLDGETGEELTRSWAGAGTDKEDKGLYKAMTGGEKFFLLKSFLMPTGNDPEMDTEKKHDRQQERQSAPRRQPGEGGAEPKADTEQAAADAFAPLEIGEDAEIVAKFVEGFKDCPACKGKGTIIRGKPEYGGGWVCWSRDKKKSCGSKWPDAKAAAPAAATATNGDDDLPFMVGAIIRKQNEYKFAQAERQAVIRDMLHGKPVEMAAREDVHKVYLFLGDHEAVQQWRVEFTRQ